MRDNKRLYTALAAAAVCLLCLLIYIGCSSSEDRGTQIHVFYLNSEETGLVSRTHSLNAESLYGRAAETMDYLSQGPVEEGLKAPLMGMDCDLDTITEKLTRAAIVNTLCELEEINRVTIRVKGALLMDEQGNKSENMTSDQFIYSTGNEMLSYENAEVHLYFATEDGKKLVETYRTVVYNANIPMERMVVEQVIAGPKGDFNYPTVNENTKIVNIVTRDNICTVTLDKTFLTNPHEVDPEVAIYSIVNSLTEIPSIRQVQILIEGEEEPVFMDSYPLDAETLLQKNTNIVQTRE